MLTHAGPFRGTAGVSSPSSYPLRIGALILPEHPWAEAISRWRRAEELGFAHAWTYDHLTWRGHRDRAWFGAIPTLTAAAMASTRLRLGPLVASPTFRHPVPFAKELITLDDISGGRLTLGIGAGSSGWDTEMLGHEPWSRAERTQRFEEFVALTDRLLRSPEVSHQGRYYSAHEARTYPGCVQQPRIPFAIAATGPRGMRLAARYAQTWVTTGDRSRTGPVSGDRATKDVAAQMARLDEACREVGRDPASVDRLVVTGPLLDSGLASPGRFADVAAAYAGIGVTDLVVPWPRPTEPYAADEAIFERIFSA